MSETTTGNNTSLEADAEEAQHENGNGIASPEAVPAAAADEPSGEASHDVGATQQVEGDEKKDKISNRDENRNERENDKEATGTAKVEPDASTPELTGVPKSITVEELPATVRARMDEVLHVENDSAMRQDTRLINFLGEVEESQVSSWPGATNVQASNRSAWIKTRVLREYLRRQPFDSNFAIVRAYRCA